MCEQLFQRMKYPTVNLRTEIATGLPMKMIKKGNIFLQDDQDQQHICKKRNKKCKIFGKC